MSQLNEEIYEVIKKSPRHMTAEEIYFLCRENDIKVSLASVYRVVGKMADVGKLKRISVSGRPDYFDKTVCGHGHLVCVECGEMVDADLKGLKEFIENQTGQTTESFDLCIKYVCPDCVKKKEMFKNNSLKGII